MRYDRSSLPGWDFYTRSSFIISSKGSPSPSSSSLPPSSTTPPSDTLCFRLAFLLLLAFFFFLTSAFNAVLLSGPFSAASIFSASRFRAILRFCVRDLVAWDFMTVPVGRCFSCTAEEVLFWWGGMLVDGRRWNSQQWIDARFSGLRARFP